MKGSPFGKPSFGYGSKGSKGGKKGKPFKGGCNPKGGKNWKGKQKHGTYAFDASYGSPYPQDQWNYGYEQHMVGQQHWQQDSGWQQQQQPLQPQIQQQSQQPQVQQGTTFIPPNSSASSQYTSVSNTPQRSYAFDAVGQSGPPSVASTKAPSSRM